MKATAMCEPHGRIDKVLFPNMPVSALPTSNREPTLSDVALQNFVLKYKYLQKIGKKFSKKSYIPLVNLLGIIYNIYNVNILISIHNNNKETTCIFQIPC